MSLSSFLFLFFSSIFSPFFFSFLHLRFNMSRRGFSFFPRFFPLFSYFSFFFLIPSPAFANMSLAAGVFIFVLVFSSRFFLVFFSLFFVFALGAGCLGHPSPQPPLASMRIPRRASEPAATGFARVQSLTTSMKNILGMEKKSPAKSLEAVY